jgi:hypothetical protein
MILGIGYCNAWPFDAKNGAMWTAARTSGGRTISMVMDHDDVEDELRFEYADVTAHQAK